MIACGLLELWLLGIAVAGCRKAWAFAKACVCGSCEE